MNQSQTENGNVAIGRLRRRPTTVQRARLCVIENEIGVVVVSAAVRATIIVCVEGDTPLEIAPGVPAFWIPERDMTAVLGEASWEKLLRRVEYDFLAISFADWSEARLLAALRPVFPTAELQLSAKDEAGASPLLPVSP